MTTARPLIPRRITRGALALGLVGALALSLSVTADASSHREAPAMVGDPLVDNTDVYAFVSPDAPDTTTIISNFIPFENPASGPNFNFFAEDALYEIHVDNNGDAVDDVTFQFDFRLDAMNGDTFLAATGPITALDDENYNLRQTYSVAVVKDGQRQVLAQDLIAPPNNIGPISTPDYDDLAAQAIYDVNADGAQMQVFAGQRDEIFPVDIGSIFDLGQLRPFLPAYQPAARDAEEGINGTAGFNVHSIAVQVPSSYLTESEDNPVVGIWSTSSRRKVRVFQNGIASPVGDAEQATSGPWVQVSRLGNPLVNEVVVPLKAKDAFLSLAPRNDIDVFPTLAAPPLSTEGDIPLVTDPILAELITQLYGVEVPPAPRADLVAIFLTGIEGLNLTVVDEGDQPAEYLRLNTSIPPTPRSEASPLGLLGGDNDGFPNGRRLVDDVVDIELQALAGATPLTPDFDVDPNNALGDGVRGNDKPYLESFPYLPAPWAGYEDPNGNVLTP